VPLLLDGPTPHTGYCLGCRGLVHEHLVPRCTGRGASETGHHVSGCTDGHRAPLKDLEKFCNQYIFRFPCGPGGGSGVGPGWVRGRVLASAFGIQLAVAPRSTWAPISDRLPPVFRHSPRSDVLSIYISCLLSLMVAVVVDVVVVVVVVFVFARLSCSLTPTPSLTYVELLLCSSACASTPFSLGTSVFCRPSSEYAWAGVFVADLTPTRYVRIRTHKICLALRSSLLLRWRLVCLWSVVCRVVGVLGYRAGCSLHVLEHRMPTAAARSAVRLDGLLAGPCRYPLCLPPCCCLLAPWASMPLLASPCLLRAY
jgi:hypothetical protein